jgi:hypothetical protein
MDNAEITPRSTPRSTPQPTPTRRFPELKEEKEEKKQSGSYKPRLATTNPSSSSTSASSSDIFFDVKYHPDYPHIVQAMGVFYGAKYRPSGTSLVWMSFPSNVIEELNRVYKRLSANSGQAVYQRNPRIPKGQFNTRLKTNKVVGYGWSVNGVEMEYLSLVNCWIDLEKDQVLSMQPIRVCGSVQTVRPDEYHTRFWVQCGLSVFATETVNPKTKEIGDLNALCFRDDRKHPNRQQNYMCSRKTQERRVRRGMKMQFGLKLATLSDDKVAPSVRVQAWGFHPIS